MPASRSSASAWRSGYRAGVTNGLGGGGEKPHLRHRHDNAYVSDFLQTFQKLMKAVIRYDPSGSATFELRRHT